MSENQKTTVFIDKEQQSFDVENRRNKSTVTITADHIIAGAVLISFK